MTPIQLLILGNGFDLHCGLKSSYKDFFRSTILDTDSELCGFPQMQDVRSGFWENLLFRYYKVYGDQDYSWCDIESIIRDTLWLIVFGEQFSEYTDMNHGLWKRALECAQLNRDPNECKDIGNIIMKFIIYYCTKFFYAELNRYRGYLEEDGLRLLINHILQELHSFERRFCKYIRNCIFTKHHELNEQYVVNAVNLLAQITEFATPDYKSIKQIRVLERLIAKGDSSQSVQLKNVSVLTEDFAQLYHTNILNFNYTALFDILGVESPCVYSNVHGKLCSEQCAETCKGANVIFGIDDTLIQSKGTNSELRLFSKTYRKMLDTSTPVSILPSNNDQPLEIKFYGHSLSEADYSYFQSIFDYYNLYSNNNVSLIFYYSKGYEQSDAVYRLLNSYGKTFANKDQGKNMIHKLLLENRLKIIELPDNVYKCA